MQVKPELARKGALRMRALVEDINRYADKCANYSGSVVPGAAVQFEDFDSVINEVDRSLWAIRTLDHEVFRASGKAEYENLRDTQRGGQAVWAFASLRDIATHRAEVVDPDIGRAVGPLSDGRFVIFPRWKKRADLPVDTFIKQDGRAYATREAAYDAHVAGRFVLDTLIDAFDFFNRCDGSLARRDADGQIEGFPLPPLPVAGVGYYRLGPQWPTYEEQEDKAVTWATGQRPVGARRTIVGTIENGAIVCGWTDEGHGRRGSFTEPVRQVAADVERGFPYLLDADDSPVIVTGGQVVTGDGQALADVLPDVTVTSEAHWPDWWQMVRDHPDLYVRQRRGQ